MSAREPNPVELMLVAVALASETGPAESNLAWVTQRAAGKRLCFHGQYIRIGTPEVGKEPAVRRQ